MKNASPVALYAIQLMRLWGEPVEEHVDHDNALPDLTLSGKGWSIRLTWSGAMYQRGHGAKKAKKLARWLSEPGTAEAWAYWREKHAERLSAERRMAE